MTLQWQVVRDRIIEARETSRLLPRVRGPAAASMQWHVAPGDNDDEEPRTPRHQPTPAAISRMEEVLGWIASLPDQADRRLLHDFAWLKTSPRARIGVWCEENGWAERIFRRRVALVCQRIADELGRSNNLRLNPADCQESEITAEVVSIALPSKTATFDRADDAIPANLPDHFDRKAVTQRLQRWAAERARRAAPAAPVNAAPDAS